MIERNESGDVAWQIVDWSIGFALQFDDNGSADFRMRG